MSNLQSGTVLVTAAATKLGPVFPRRFARDRIGHGTVAALRSRRYGARAADPDGFGASRSGLRTHLSGSPADTWNGPLQSEVVAYVVFRARHGRIRIDNVSQEPVSGGGEVAACVNGPRLRHKAIAEHVGPSRDGCKSGVWPFVARFQGGVGGCDQTGRSILTLLAPSGGFACLEVVVPNHQPGLRVG